MQNDTPNTMPERNLAIAIWIRQPRDLIGRLLMREGQTKPPSASFRPVFFAAYQLPACFLSNHRAEMEGYFCTRLQPAGKKLAFRHSQQPMKKFPQRVRGSWIGDWARCRLRGRRNVERMHVRFSRGGIAASLVGRCCSGDYLLSPHRPVIG